ncbi:PREDICTED: protein FAM186A [Chrysochloris asiatica]|uniref:Protein FAM186A n=1 Tax=Chrysochloris asiatica TaxID=185453 RepID=A0A9B0TYK9_CHRAS|nr:PREDICTED: protein FAM186A [Chrysochloris asiatica]
MFLRALSEADSESESEKESSTITSSGFKNVLDAPVVPTMEIPFSSQDVISRIDQAQLCRAKKDISIQLNDILCNVTRIINRYTVDQSLVFGKRASIVEYNRNQRSNFMERISTFSHTLEVREKILAQILAWLEEWSVILSNVTTTEVEEHSHWVAQMEILPATLRAIESYVKILSKISLSLFEDKKRQKKKTISRGTLWKPWKERVTKRPATAHALRPDQMISDEFTTNAKVSEIRDMLQELVGSSLFSKMENNAIKYMSSTITNLSEALHIVNEELKIQLPSDNILLDETDKTEKQFSVKIIEDLSEKNEILQQQLQNAEEKCEQLIRSKGFLEQQLQVLAAASLEVLPKPSQQSSVSLVKEDNIEDSMDAILAKEFEIIADESPKKGTKSPGIKWDLAISHAVQDKMTPHSIKQQRTLPDKTHKLSPEVITEDKAGIHQKDKIDQYQSQNRMRIEKTHMGETSGSKLSDEKGEQKDSRDKPEPHALGKKGKVIKPPSEAKSKLTTESKGQYTPTDSSSIVTRRQSDKSVAGSKWERLRVKPYYQADRRKFSSELSTSESKDKESKTEMSSPAESFRPIQFEKMKEKTHHISPERKTEEKEMLALPKQAKPHELVKSYSRTAKKTSEFASTVSKLSEQSSLEEFQKTIMTFLKEKIDNVGKPFDQKTELTEELLLKRAEAKKLGIIKDKLEEYFQKVAEIITKTLKKYKDMKRAGQDGEKLKQSKEVGSFRPELQTQKTSTSAKSEISTFLSHENMDPIINNLVQMILTEIESDRDVPVVSILGRDHKEKEQRLGEYLQGSKKSSVVNLKQQLRGKKDLWKESLEMVYKNLEKEKTEHQMKVGKQFQEKQKPWHEKEARKGQQKQWTEQVQKQKQRGKEEEWWQMKEKVILLKEEEKMKQVPEEARQLELTRRWEKQEEKQKLRTSFERQRQKEVMDQVTIKEKKPEDLERMLPSDNIQSSGQKSMLKDASHFYPRKEIQTSPKSFEILPDGQHTTPIIPPTSMQSSPPEVFPGLGDSHSKWTTLSPEQAQALGMTLDTTQAQEQRITFAPKQAQTETITLTPRQAQSLGMTLTPEEAQTLGITLTPQQTQTRGVTLTPEEAQGRGVTLNPEEAQERGITLTPQQAQALGVTLTPQQAQALGIALTPQQAQALGVTLTPQQAQARGVTLTPEEAQARGYSLTPEEAQALGIALTPQQAQALGIALTPQQAQALGVILTPEEAQARGITLTPQQTQARGITLAPEEAQARGVTLTPQQAQALGITLTPQQAQALWVTLTLEEAQARGVTLTPQQTQARGITLTPQQAQALGVTLTPEEAQAMEVTLTPQQTQARGITLTPEEVQARGVTLTPQQAQALGIALSPQQAQALEITRTPEEAQARGVTLTPEEAQASGINLTPEEAQTRGVTLIPEEVQAKGVTLTPEEAQARGVTLTPQQAQALGITLTPEEAQTLGIALTPQQIQARGVTLTPEEAQALGITLIPQQVKALGVTLTPEQAMALVIPFIPAQAQELRIGLTPEQTQALGITLTTEPVYESGFPLTPEQAQSLGVPLSSEQSQALGVPLTKEQAKKLGVPITLEDIQGLQTLKQTHILGVTPSPEQVQATGISLSLRVPLTVGRAQELGIPITSENAWVSTATPTLKQVQALRPFITLEQAKALGIPLTPEQFRELGIPLASDKAHELGLSFIPEEVQPLWGPAIPGQALTMGNTLMPEQDLKSRAPSTGEQPSQLWTGPPSRHTPEVSDQAFTPSASNISKQFPILAPPTVTPFQELKAPVSPRQLFTSRFSLSPRQFMATSVIPETSSILGISSPLHISRPSLTKSPYSFERTLVIGTASDSKKLLTPHTLPSSTSRPMPKKFLAPEVPPTPRQFFISKDSFIPQSPPILKPSLPCRESIPEVPTASRQIPSLSPGQPLVSGAHSISEEFLKSRPFTPAELPQVFQTPLWGPSTHGQHLASWIHPTPGQLSPLQVPHAHGQPPTLWAPPIPRKPQEDLTSSVTEKSKKELEIISSLESKSAVVTPTAPKFQPPPVPLTTKKLQMPEVSDTFEESQLLLSKDPFAMKQFRTIQPHLTDYMRTPVSQIPYVGEGALSTLLKPITLLPSLATQPPKTSQVSLSEWDQKSRFPPIDKSWILSSISATKKPKIIVPPSSPQDLEEKYFVDVKAQRKNLVLLNQATKTSGFPSQLYATVRTLIIETLHSDAVRLGYLFRKYIAYRLIQRARKNLLKRLKAIQNTGKGYETQDLYKMLGRTDDYQKKVMQIWTEKQKSLEQKRNQCLRKMMCLYSQLQETYKLNLSQPTVITNEKQILASTKFIHQPFLELLTEENRKSNSFGKYKQQKDPMEAIWNVDLSATSYPIAEKTSMHSLWAQLGGYPDIPRLLQLDVHSTFRKSLASIQSQNLERGDFNSLKGSCHELL